MLSSHSFRLSRPLPLTARTPPLATLSTDPDVGALKLKWGTRLAPEKDEVERAEGEERGEGTCQDGESRRITVAKRSLMRETRKLPLLAHDFASFPCLVSVFSQTWSIGSGIGE